MARWDEFLWGDGVPWGRYPPTRAHTRGGYYVPLIRNAVTGALFPTTSIVESVSVSQEFGLSGLARASVECINPSGANSSTYADGDLIRIEVAISAPGGSAYTSDLGRFRVRTPIVGRSAGSARWTLSLDCVPELEERLRFPVSGDLPVTAASVARRFGLLAPDNTTASIPGIIAYLLVTGGITAVRTKGYVVNMQAYIEATDDGYSGPWNLSPQQAAYRVLGTLEEAAGVYVYVDIDGTGVIAARPRSVFDLHASPPVRRWADTGTDAVMRSISRKPLTQLEQVQLTNQTSLATDQIIFAMPAGQGVPIDANLDTSVSARTVNTASYAPWDDDPSLAAEMRARQIAYDESLRAVDVRVSGTGDPGLWAGDVVRMADPTGGTEGPHLLRRITHSYPRAGREKIEALAQPLNEAIASESRAIGSTTYTYGDRALLFQIGSTASVASNVLRTGQAAIHSIDAYASLVPSGSFTLEGFFLFQSWPKIAAGSNIALALLVAPACDLVLSGGSGATMTATATIYTTGGAVALSGFNVTNNGNTWIHFRMVHNAAADSFRVWLDGTLQASSTSVTNAPSAQYRDVRVLSYLGAGATVSASTVGLAAVCQVRYRADAVITDNSNFTVPSTPFTDSDSPCILHWPCRDFAGSLRPEYVYSTAGNIYGRMVGARVGQTPTWFIPFSSVAAPF